MHVGDKCDSNVRHQTFAHLDNVDAQLVGPYQLLQIDEPSYQLLIARIEKLQISLPALGLTCPVAMI